MAASWVQMRAIGTPRSERGGLGVTPQLYEEMSLIRNTLLENMREEAPVNKNPNAPNRGALRKSIKASPWVTNGSIWRTDFSALDYIQYVIHGTKPHEIRPRKPGGVLAIRGPIGVSSSLPAISHLSSGGKPMTLGRRGGPSIFSAPPGHPELRGDTIFLNVVHHPGTQANNFVERAMLKTFVETMPGFTERVKQAIEDEVIQFTIVRRVA